MFVIGDLLSALDLNILIIVPVVFTIVYFVNLLLLRTLFTWLSKIKVIGIIIMVIYALIAILLAFGMHSIINVEEFDQMTAYCSCGVLLAIAIFSFNYLSYSPLFNNTYYDGAYVQEYHHTEHHIFSPDVHYYTESWHEWQQSGAQVATKVSLYVGIGIFFASLIFNALIVVGVYAVVRILYKVLNKDDDTLSYS